MASIAVLGAGVVGLSTAINIQATIPDSNVVIFADKFADDTTSSIAAGVYMPWGPGDKFKAPARSVQEYRDWCVDSFMWYDQLWRSPEAGEAGIQKISGYEVFCEKYQLPEFGVRYDFREMSQGELDRFPSEYTYGWFFTTLMAEGFKYLPWLMRRVNNNGRVCDKHIQSLAEVRDFDVVVNCLGLGSREVFGDQGVYPVRGHVVRVKAPWVKHFVFAHTVEGGSVYIFPGQDNVVLGGTHEVNEYGLDHDSNKYDTIIKQTASMIPSLKRAPVEKYSVGLRPVRSTVRVERESILVGDKRVKVVHNYGHGADGVALSWGTAVHAARHVEEALRQQPGEISKL
ncbi:hypothetical protein ScPMuIL_015148 [Solemya velum]